MDLSTLCDVDRLKIIQKEKTLANLCVISKPTSPEG